jgi:hypothetical protein
MIAIANWFYLKRIQSYGFSGAGGVLGLLCVVARLTILYREIRLAQRFPGPRHRSVDFRRVLTGVIFLRRQPENLSLFPDGANPAIRTIPETKRRSRQEEQFEHSWKLREALRTRTIWLLIARAFLASSSTGGIAFHLVAYYTDVSIDPAIGSGCAQPDGTIRNSR